MKQKVIDAIMHDDAIMVQVNGQFHCETGPAIKAPEAEVWCLNNVIHRAGGPALIAPGVEAWYQNGLLHREDGPAVIITGDTNKVEYWEHGVKV